MTSEGTNQIRSHGCGCRSTRRDARTHHSLFDASIGVAGADIIIELPASLEDTAAIEAGVGESRQTRGEEIGRC